MIPALLFRLLAFLQLVQLVDLKMLFGSYNMRWLYPKKRTDPQWNSEDFQEQILFTQNYYRQMHCSTDLIFSERLTRKAKRYSEQMTLLGKRVYDRKELANDAGLNIWWANYRPTGMDVIDDWYSEIDFYNFDQPKVDQSTEHLVRMLWRNHTQMGSFVAEAATEGVWYVAAFYTQLGNYSNSIALKKNVIKEKCKSRLEHPLELMKKYKRLSS